MVRVTALNRYPPLTLTITPNCHPEETTVALAKVGDVGICCLWDCHGSTTLTTGSPLRGLTMTNWYLLNLVESFAPLGHEVKFRIYSGALAKQYTNTAHIEY